MNDEHKIQGAGRHMDAEDRLLAQLRDMPVPQAEGLAERIIARAAREPRKEHVQEGFGQRLRKALFGAPVPASPRGAWMRPAAGFALAAFVILMLSPVWMERPVVTSEQPVAGEEVVAMADGPNNGMDHDTSTDLRSDFDLLILQDMEDVFL